MNGGVKRRIFAAIAAMCIVMSAAGCGTTAESSSVEKHTATSKAEESAVAESVESIGDVSEIVDSNNEESDLPYYFKKARECTYRIEDGANVVFIGNSLTRFGDLPLYFEKMFADRNVTVTSECCDGFAFVDLQQAITEKEEWLAALRDADVVILQGYGGEFDAEPMEKLLDEATHLKQAYFFVNDFCTENVMEYKLTEEVENGLKNFKYDIAPLGWGFVSADLYNIFGDDFYQQDGYHPTQVNGLLTSLYFYEVLTGESCENAEYTQLPSTINMFGGEEALEDLMQQGKKVIDDFYDLSMGIEK